MRNQQWIAAVLGVIAIGVSVEIFASNDSLKTPVSWDIQNLFHLLGEKPFEWAERGWLPDALVQFGIRRMLAEKLIEERSKPENSVNEFVDMMNNSPIAVQPQAANEQHYEVPAAYFAAVLGPRLKYSATYWPNGVSNLRQSELAALELVAERAQLRDGQAVLDLGCGWGSFTLWAAERYPNSSVLGCRTQLRSAHSLWRAQRSAACATCVWSRRT